MKGILGRKVGMTRIFLDSGKSIPVTLIQMGDNVVTKVLTKEKDGYVALQVASFDKKKSRSNKPEIGHFKKSNTTAKRFVKEFRNMDGFELGKKIPSTIFNVGDFVDVTGTSKGKGFAGTIKRHNQSIGPKSHGGGGGSKPTRQTGSIGSPRDKRVIKGMTMPGHMGAKQRTKQNLEVIEINEKENLIIVKGSIPGPNKAFVIVRECAKQIPSTTPVKLVDLKEVHEKNELLEEAKKVGADVNTDMPLEEMRNAVNKAKEAKEAERIAQEQAELAKEAILKEKTLKEQSVAAKEATKEALSNETNKEVIANLKEQEKQIESQLTAATKQKEKVKVAALEAQVVAKAAEKASDKLQVEVEDLNADKDKEESK